MMVAGGEPTTRVETAAIARGGGTVHVVTVDGPLELPTVGALRAELGRISRTAAPRILVDLMSVDFLDLAGVTTLYRAGATATAFAIAVAPGSQPARTLELCRLNGLMPAFAGIAEALAALG